MICKTCSFETDRLIVGEWHSLPFADRRPDKQDTVPRLQPVRPKNIGAVLLLNKLLDRATKKGPR